MTRKVDQGVVSALASLMKAQMLDCPFGQPKKKLPKDAARCGLVPRDERVLFVLAAWLYEGDHKEEAKRLQNMAHRSVAAKFTAGILTAVPPTFHYLPKWEVWMSYDTGE